MLIEAPGAVGPFAWFIKVSKLLFASGQLLIDPATKEFNFDGAITQAEQCRRNLAAIGVSAGSTTAAGGAQAARPS